MSKTMLTSNHTTEAMDTLFGILEAEDGASLVVDTECDAQSRIDQPWVLSIDDDDNMALALKMRLEEVGVQVLRAAAGMEGYREAFLTAPQAIILDYELPQGNGDYVLRRLKESPVTQDIPVVVLTGRHEKAIERQMRNLGAHEFLTKPFKWKQLWAILEGCLDSHAERTDSESNSD